VNSYITQADDGWFTLYIKGRAVFRSMVYSQISKHTIDQMEQALEKYNEKRN